MELDGSYVPKTDFDEIHREFAGGGNSWECFSSLPSRRKHI